MGFEFATAGRIIFGNGKVAQLSDLVLGYGRRVLLVAGASVQSVEQARDLIANRGLQVVVFQVRGEPTLDLVRSGVELSRQSKCEVVVSVGGGSAIDTGKAIAVLTTNPGDALDYLEVIGLGKSLVNAGLPFIAVPTTSGTGSEVTRNAVIGSLDHGVKVSLRSNSMYPRVALIDPVLSHSLPADHTAASGMDALTQLIEPFTCNSPTPIVDAVCVDGIQLAARNLLAAFKDGSDPAAREAMSLASLYGGMALANAKLGAVHGFAAPIGGSRPAPHGAICARLLPVVMEINIQALRARLPDSQVLGRYQTVARLLTGDDHADADAGVAWVYNLRQELGIPPLHSYGFTNSDISGLVEKAAKASSMKGNPIQLTTKEMELIMERGL